ncbi:flagellar protein FlgN [Methylocaldum sp.]|uniref:flagella synthesis protein FlgN n=1 Tax=Methylocaldum sp. TaxID=1969727 RepID=UPI002D3B556A|nr:flagellar protein FlgN [Methylocaldum sp.]HYE33924.1 flagellar protein FlgN [Methylocaldum sp.]
MTAHAQKLRELFRQMLDGLGGMLSLLEKESECLAAREIEAVEAASSKKQKLAFLLNDLAARQTGFVHAYGLPSDAGNINTFLDRLDSELPEVETLRAEWREIVRLTLACRRQNELNGAYIGLLRRHVDSSLNFLHGFSSAGATYGPDGSRCRGEISRQSFSV